jgi:hypothetical protein
MLSEARASGDPRLETRALYIWGCRQKRIMERERPYIGRDRFARRRFWHCQHNYINLPHAIQDAVRRTYE